MELKELKSKIDSVNPYQKQAFLDSFKDIEIDWDLKFFSLENKGNNIYKITCHESEYKKSPFVLIIFEININEYPYLKIIPKNEILNIKGKISLIKSYSIFLKDILINNEINKSSFKKDENDKQMIYNPAKDVLKRIKYSGKEWYEKPFGNIIIGIIITLIGGALLFWFGLN